jgi:hypothetical protein
MWLIQFVFLRFISRSMFLSSLTTCKTSLYSCVIYGT